MMESQSHRKANWGFRSPPRFERQPEDALSPILGLRLLGRALATRAAHVPAGPRTHPHRFATDLRDAGCGIRTVHELPGQRNAETAMLSTHVLERGGHGVESPTDRLSPDGARSRGKPRRAVRRRGPSRWIARSRLAKPDDQDVDLTAVRGQTGVAAGDVFVVSGFVRNRKGEPVAGATIEVWQANAYGRYLHPSDHNTAAPLDPHFDGYAVVRTDAEGRYRFRTIKPGPYPAFDGDWMRAPHIHFDVRGRFDRKITQMYFPSEALNAQDRIFQAVRRPDALLASVSRLPPDDSAGAAESSATWDIIVASG
jgi:protocatechuate 3,4-dioxygenase beta subunit